ncbi:MAG: hypothetical protein AABY68_04040 [Pseudomonadota bacterium]
MPNQTNEKKSYVSPDIIELDVLNSTQADPNATRFPDDLGLASDAS